MNLLEILLLLAGSLIFVVSFWLPAKKEEQLEGTKELAKEEISELVGQEMIRVKEQVTDTVDETITYAVEKTERFMDRMSNEKMMAINEYSDTVIEDIHKTHTEVMFLYDMLNDKYESLKTTAVEVDKTVKAVREAAVLGEQPGQENESEKKDTEEESLAQELSAAEETENGLEEFGQQAADMDISFANVGMENNNDEILRLHRQGKSKAGPEKGGRRVYDQDRRDSGESYGEVWKRGLFES